MTKNQMPECAHRVPFDTDCGKCAQAAVQQYSDDEHTLMCAAENLRSVERNSDAAFRLASKLDDMRKRGVVRPIKASAPGLSDDVRAAVRDAVAQALGDAYDCTRVWEAWSVGTMSQDDFELVAEDDNRVAEIADAAIDALTRASAATVAEPSTANTLAGFQGACAVNGRLPTEQEIWDAGVRSGMRRAEAAQQQAEPGADERIACFPDAKLNECAMLASGQQTEKMRESFEAYIMDLHPNAHEDVSEQRAGDEYIHQSTTGKWLAWKAACKWQARASQSGQSSEPGADELTKFEAWLAAHPYPITWRERGAFFAGYRAAQSGQRAGVAEDAARYRWLRERRFYKADNPHTSMYHKGGCDTGWLYLKTLDRDGLDAAIDAAIDAAPTQQQEGGK